MVPAYPLGIAVVNGLSMLGCKETNRTMHKQQIATNTIIEDVRYEIRGELAHRAHELERQGYEIISLNIGNPGLFGYRTPETMRLAMIENLHSSEGYCHQKGIFPAREAVVMQQQDRGVMDASADDVFIGNGVSELIMMTMRALLNPGDEVLVPSPDYPLWTAAVTLNGGKAVHYPCPPHEAFQPDLDALDAGADDPDDRRVDVRDVAHDRVLAFDVGADQLGQLVGQGQVDGLGVDEGQLVGRAPPVEVVTAIAPVAAFPLSEP